MERIHSAATQDRGFTVMELMAVVLVIAILLGIAIATYIPATRSAAAASCRHNQRVLEDAYLQAELTVGSEDPDDIEDLEPFVENFGRVKLCPLDGTELDFDAATGDISCPNHP